MNTSTGHLAQMNLTSESLLKNTSELTALTLDGSTSELDVIKNRKNFTVAVRIKPQSNAPPSTLINLSVKKLSQKSEELKLNFEGRRYEYNSYGQSGEKKFVFDKVYQSQTENHEIFSTLIEKKLGLLKNGVNLSLMAYGATNSGKTYTIFGKNQSDSKNNVPGLSYMTFKKVFETHKNQYEMAFSFVQIYNQNVYDLLSSVSVMNPLNVMEDSQGNTNVIGLNKVQISAASQLQKLISFGNEARISCSNLQNIHSSRSHAFMELQLRHKITKQKTKMVVVDLAGSEKYLYNGSNAGNSLLKEGANINKSLLSLGNCIKSLYQNDQHISYRDSKLTRLLKENLSGYAHNIMIACINKKINNFEENLNSLNYALKAIKIEKEILRKVQSEQLSQYQCTNCHQKLPYSLIKDINKHQQHKKRVKTRQSQSLSVSPISKNGIENGAFNSQAIKSGKKTYKKIQKAIDESFQRVLAHLNNQSLSIENLVRIILQEKASLKSQMKEGILCSKSKMLQKYDTSSSQIMVSEFQSPCQPKSQQSQAITSNSDVPEKKLKISLSKPKKQKLQNTATTENVKNEEQKSIQQTKQFTSTQNYIRIQDSPSDQDSSGLHSFRSNLTVQILDDKDKILNERRKVLEQTSYNQRRNSGQSMGILKFKSSQSNLRSKNIGNFINSSESNPKNKIKFKSNFNFNQQMRLKDQTQNDISSFEDFMINQRMLDSTSIAPRMKRDEDEILGTWKNIVIKNVESPSGLVLGQATNEESFVEDKQNVADERTSRLFRVIRY